MESVPAVVGAFNGAHRAARLVVTVVVAVVSAGALLVPLFAGLAVDLEPRDLPIAVAGPPPDTEAFRAELERDRPGAFDVLAVPDAASADAGIEDRSVYGAIVLTSHGVTVHVTSAGSPVVAALLTEVAADLGPARVLDVVPGDPDDPDGASFSAAFLPLAITAVLAAVLTWLFVPGHAARVTALLALSVLVGLTTAAVQQHWLRTLSGDYPSIAAAIALLTLAVAATVTGLGALLGRVGIILGTVLVALVGGALSAVATAPELLPQPWGEVGHFLPIGAGATLLRSVAYFGGSGATPEAATLIAYATAGLALVCTRSVSGPRRAACTPTRSPRVRSAPGCCVVTLPAEKVQYRSPSS